MRPFWLGLLPLVPYSCSQDVNLGKSPNLAPAATILSPADQSVFTELDSVDFAGPRTALARVSGRMLGNAYTDFLSLGQVGGRWQVIAKVFHAEPAGR